jgi:hypothetical protein
MREDFIQQGVATLHDEVRKKANEVLDELTLDNIKYFVRESGLIAGSILNEYIYAVFDYYLNKGFENSIKKDEFINPETGYQQKMFIWKEDNNPNVEVELEIPTRPQKPSEKKCHYVTLGIGTAGALGFEIGRRCKDGHRYWIGIAREVLTLATSYFIYKKEQGDSDIYNDKLRQYEAELKIKKDTIANETINQYEAWLKNGETYSNELLTSFNL